MWGKPPSNVCSPLRHGRNAATGEIISRPSDTPEPKAHSLSLGAKCPTLAQADSQKTLLLPSRSRTKSWRGFCETETRLEESENLSREELVTQESWSLKPTNKTPQ